MTKVPTSLLRATFCSVLALLIMAVSMLILMVVLHYADLKLVASGEYSTCCFICPACGSKTSISNLKD